MSNITLLKCIEVPTITGSPENERRNLRKEIVTGVRKP